MSARSTIHRGLVVGFGMVVLQHAAAQTLLGSAFTYQGRLQQAGNPASGPHDLRFRLYDALAVGAQVGPTLCADNVNVIDGLVTVPLDFGAQFAGQERFLQIDVRADTGLDCGNAAGFVALFPRQALTAAPNALFASNADRLDGLDSTAFLQSIPVPLTLTGNNAAHIIRGTNTSTTNVSSAVVGISVAATGGTYGVAGQSDSTSGRGVIGFALAGSGSAYGGEFQTNSTSGRGVFGHADASSGFTNGGWFQSASTSGNGVVGQATAASGVTYGVVGENLSTSGRGVYGVAQNSTGVTNGVYGLSNSSSDNAVGVFGRAAGASGVTFGGRFESASTSGIGVFGFSTATSGATYGMYGRSDSPFGIGVYGVTTATTGGNFGVYGQSDSPAGYGVLGIATATSGVTYGVYGRSDSLDGVGVYGVATNSSAPSGPPTYGMLGQAFSGGIGWAIYANGDFGASGSKNFRIDHPDDPASKYLLHYSAESPEVINFYRGTVVLDGAGEAVVELPHYFAKINKTPSYMLTAVGAPMPLLHVAAEIDEAALSAGAKAEPGETATLCSFRIAGGAPGAKVSWRVEAVRNDRWVQQRGAPVEVEKQGLEKGTYQHPELYGQPAEKGMNYDAERASSLSEAVRQEHD